MSPAPSQSQALPQVPLGDSSLVAPKIPEGIKKNFLKTAIQNATVKDSQNIRNRASAPGNTTPVSNALTTISPTNPPKDSTPAKPKSVDTTSPPIQQSVADTLDYAARILRYDAQRKVFRLREQAVLKWQGAELHADTIDYATEERVLVAMGQPRIKEPRLPPVVGERMKYNLESRVGQVYYGSSFRDGQQFNGMDVRRLPDGRMLIARGDFSTCDTLEHQHFYFYSRKMVVQPGDMVVAKPVVMNIADVPVAILPMMANPLNKERRSGLLMPKFGGDQNQGFYMENLGWYWAINDYMDLDARADLVEGTEGKFDQSTAKSLFRYKKRYDLEGYLDGTWYFNDFTQETQGWDLSYRHQQNLTPDGRTTLNGEGSIVSRPTVRQERGLDRQTVLNQTANANLAFRKQFRDNSVLSIAGQQERNLTPATSNGQSRRYFLRRTLPDIQYSRSGNPFRDEDLALDPLHEESWFERIAYSYSGASSALLHETTDSAGTETLDTLWWGYRQTTGFNLPATTGPVTWNSAINLRSFWTPERFDADSNRISDMDFGSGDVGTWWHKPSLDLTASTKLFGIWRPEWGEFVGVRHTLTPQVGWTMAPKMDSIPLLVYHPRLHERSGQEAQQTLRLGLNQDFDAKVIKEWTSGDSAKPKTNNFKVLSTSTNTGYNFEADSLHWQNIQSNVSLMVSPSERLSINTTHSLYDQFAPTRQERLREQSPILEAWSFGLSRSLSWKGWLHSGINDSLSEDLPWSARMSYNFGFNSRRVGPKLYQNTSSHSANANLGIKPTPHWDVDYSTSYDFVNGRFAEHRFTFNRELHCWQLRFSWTPTGPAAGWTFQVWVTDIPDIELHTSNRGTSSR